MSKPILYGPGFSTYVRTCRLALIEKGVDYDLEEFDFFQGMPPEQLERHPFGKVPAFRHEDFVLYEAAAITRYVDEAFPGPALQPDHPRQRARMVQICSILDSYGYGSIIGSIVIQRLVLPMLGDTTNEEIISGALPMARKCLEVLDELLGDQPYLAGATLSLADLHLAPVYNYISATPDGAPLLATTANLRRWWEQMAARPSLVATVPDLG